MQLWPGETPPNPQDYDTVVWGKYKILIAETDGEVDPITGEYILTKSWDSLYFDLSTTNYPWNYGGQNGAPDMFFRYEWNSNIGVPIQSFTSIAMGGPTGQHKVYNVTKGSTVAIWDNYYNPGAPTQSYSNIYVAAPAHFNLGANTSGQHCPKLTWVAESFPLTYKIYRKINNGSFSLYGNLTNSTANQFIDYELAGAGTGSNMVYYYITATNGSYTSSPTTTKSINWNYEGFGKNISFEATPQKFDLKQNYPNPFNPSTEISFQLPSKTHTTLIVYDMLGRKVRILVDEVKEAGNYSVGWNGKDDQGISLSSGVYLYQIRAGNFSQTKRMMFVK